MANPKQGRQLLAAVTYAGRLPGWHDYLYGFFASMYYAGLRPGEANRLRETDCKLPETGWGWLATGLSPVEVAERAGHSVAVLLKVYAAVLDGQQETSNQKIGDLLGDDD